MMYEVTYTGDYGETYTTVTVEASSYTQAYVDVYCKLKSNEAITDCKEVK